MSKNLSLVVGFLITHCFVGNNFSAAMLVDSSDELLFTPLKFQWLKKEEKKSIEQNKRVLDSPVESDTPLKRQNTSNKEFTPQNDGLKVPIFSPLLNQSPAWAESNYFTKYRLLLALQEYSTETQKKNAVCTPLVREIYNKNDTGNYFSRRLNVSGKTVFQADFLIDPSAEVLTECQWMTNLERMKKGLCPVGHRGITPLEKRVTLTQDAIEKQQKKYRIELQHVTQKDTGTDEDPLCEMTHVAHMGKDDRLIMRYDVKTRCTEIIHFGLTKEKALKLCKPGEFIVTNVLHFRKGASTIDRDQFASWRKDYWKERAVTIEKGTFIGRDRLPKLVEQKKLFS